MYKYGLLETIGGHLNRTNPIYCGEVSLAKNEEKIFTIIGKGIVNQITFRATSLNALISVKIDDDKEFSKVNNVHCALHLTGKQYCNQYVTAEKNDDKTYLFNCIIPFVFDKKIEVRINNENGEEGKISWIHIYYLVEDKKNG